MKVSLVIPVRNEEANIGRLLKEEPKNLLDEIIVVDGKSTDKTVAVCKANLRKSDRVIIQKGMGYGAAIKEGFDAAKGDVVIVMDADGSHNPADIPFLIKKVQEGYDYVMASRYAVGGKSEDDTFIRWFGNQLFTRLTNLIHGTRVTDSLYLFTAIRKDGLKKLDLKSPGFEFCTEIVVKAHKAGLRFAEVPAIERARFSGNSKVNAFWHGLKILKMVVKKYD